MQSLTWSSTTFHVPNSRGIAPSVRPAVPPGRKTCRCITTREPPSQLMVSPCVLRYLVAVYVDFV